MWTSAERSFWISSSLIDNREKISGEPEKEKMMTYFGCKIAGKAIFILMQNQV
jgi:hypothetical protein